MNRGEIWWANLLPPAGSGPGYRRPVLIIQADSFNRSRISTIIIAVITKNLDLADAPGNVLLGARSSHLAVDSAINVSQLMTIDKSLLTEYVSTLAGKKMKQVESGLRLVLEL
jgi:mRNA interferase MazF